MGQDLREMFDRERKEARFVLKVGHDKRFADKLDKAMPRAKKRYGLLKIAASVLVIFGLGITAYIQLSDKESISTTVVSKQQDNTPFSLGDLSPDLKKVENYYVATINLEFSKLVVSEDNKAMVDGFMNQLSELNDEYESLTVELNQMGPNDQTISALIENLELRLQLLQKLKKKLNQLKSSKNEQTHNNSI
jgi:predicted RNase H-like nuclease (RuvC/YqgF family)